MNKLKSLFTLALLLPAAAQAAYTVPYSSPLSDGTTTDSEWTSYTSVRRGVTWAQARGTAADALDFTTTGTQGAIECMYDQENALDAWFISPAITLSTGVNYTLKLYIQTKDYGSSTENFEIRMAEESSASALKAGTQVIDKPGYSHPGSWELIEVPLTVSVSGDYHFGLHSYSQIDQGHLFATGFSITSDSQGGGGDDPHPSTAKQLPYTTTFATVDEFNEWTVAKGSSSTSSNSWNYNSYLSCPQFEAEGMIEDDWLISPAINLSEASAFSLDYTYTAYGDYEIRVGTDKDDLSSFNQLIKSQTGITNFDTEDKVIFSIDTPGEYYIALRANAPQGSFMGYRLNKFAVAACALTPAIITDLKAKAADDNSLQITVTWSNPSLTNAGTPLSEIGNISILRNGVTICASHSDMTPGSTTSFIDTPDAPGVYEYTVIAEGVDGAAAEGNLTVRSDYAGRPETAMPFNFNVTSADDSERDKWNSIDADADGNGWAVEVDYSTTSFRSDTDSQGIADNYLVSPYITLNPGNYRIRWSMYAKSNSYEVGYATDYRNPASTFVKIADIADVTQYGYQENESIFALDTAGDYVLIWRHTGSSDPESQHCINLSAASLEEVPVLPSIATELAATSTVSNPSTVTLTWRNPAIDNAGAQLTSLSHASILRDGEPLGTVNDIEPGKSASFTDPNVDGGKEYTYTVEIYNENGKSEEDPASVTLYVGEGKSVPYESNFSEWKPINVNDDWYEWTISDTGCFEFEQSWGSTDDHIISPYILFEDGYNYSIAVTTEGIADSSGNTEPMTWHLTAGTARDAASMKHIASFTTESDAEQTDNATVSAVSTIPRSDETSANPQIPAGNVAIGIHTDNTGRIRVKSVTVEKEGLTGISTVYSTSKLMTYSGGTLFLAPAVEKIIICDLSGHIIYSGSNPGSYDMPAGIYIVNVKSGSRTETLKISR